MSPPVTYLALILSSSGALAAVSVETMLARGLDRTAGSPLMAGHSQGEEGVAAAVVGDKTSTGAPGSAA